MGSHLPPYIPFSIIKCISMLVISLISTLDIFNIALLEQPGKDMQ